MERLDYGSFAYRGDKDYVKNYPHTLLFEANSEALLRVHIIFSNMKKMNIGLDYSRKMLDVYHQKMFINELFLASVRRLLDEDLDRYNRCGGSYEESMAFGLHNGLNFLFGSDMPGLVQIMRAVAKENEHLAMYRHFVFVCSWVQGHSI